VDTVLYIGTVRLSEKMHNDGLEKLKVGDLFHGIQSLTKSISINKNNVSARNLLGLALYEIGHLGDALKHWETSVTMLADENPATQYIEAVNKSSRRMDNMSDAIIMFNQALAHITQKSDDLAIIQLKKAVEMNPSFVDALNLLTLCYLIQNDRDRALAIAERVLLIDIFNPVALNYYNILSPGKSRPGRASSSPAKKKPQRSAPPPPPVQPSAPYKAISMEEKKPRNFRLTELLSFLIGVGLTVGVAYFLLVPAFESAREAERGDAEIARAEQSQRYRDQIDDVEERRQQLLYEIAIHGVTISELETALSMAHRANAVHDAFIMYQRGDLREAVAAVEFINRIGLEHELQNRIDYILDNSIPALGEEYYNSGLASFNRNPRDSYMALVQLQNARHYLTADVPQWNRLLFMLGVLYYDDGRIEEAYANLDELRIRAPGLPATAATPNFTGAERTLFNNMFTSIDAQR